MRVRGGEDVCDAEDYAGDGADGDGVRALPVAREAGREAAPGPREGSFADVVDDAIAGAAARLRDYGCVAAFGA